MLCCHCSSGYGNVRQYYVIHLWGAPLVFLHMRKGTTHIIYYCQSLMLRERSVDDHFCYDTVESRGVETMKCLYMSRHYFFFSWALLVLLFCPVYCQGFFLLMWCGAFLRWTTTLTDAKPSQAKPSQAKPRQAKPSQANVLTGGGDLREAQVDVPLSVSHSCVWPYRWAL
jgi:hypothetical protein